MSKIIPPEILLDPLFLGGEFLYLSEQGAATKALWHKALINSFQHRLEHGLGPFGNSWCFYLSVVLRLGSLALPSFCSWSLYKWIGYWTIFIHFDGFHLKPDYFR